MATSSVPSQVATVASPIVVKAPTLSSQSHPSDTSFAHVRCGGIPASRTLVSLMWHDISNNSICGKRSRSNSFASLDSDASVNGSSSSSSPLSSSDGYSSLGSRVFSDSDSASDDAESPATSTIDSPEQITDDVTRQKLRTCPSPSRAKRKTVRCLRKHTACTAPSATLESDVADLGGAVQAFALSSQASERNSPAGVSSASSSAAAAAASSSSISPPSPDAGLIKTSVVDHLVGKYFVNLRFSVNGTLIDRHTNSYCS